VILTAASGGALATIPSPTQGVWYVGALPVRAYALFILMGILVAVQLGERRWAERGGRRGVILDIAAWAVPFGIVGGRLYHVVTSWQPYFGSGGHPVRALYIWEGGLGIWGAVALGALGAWIGARRAGILLPPLADALAPGIVLAQAIGRWGNWFNNELYGGRTDLPWGLRVYQWNQEAGHAVRDQQGRPIVLGTFHPTFLYESLWDVGTALVLLWADRRWKLGHGRVFALYALLYTLGRGWIEALRVDPANTVLGLRLNLWTSLLVGLAALVGLLLSARLRPGRETVLTWAGVRAAAEAAGETSDSEKAGDAPDADEPADPKAAKAAAADGKDGGDAKDPDETGTSTADGEPTDDPDADQASPAAGTTVRVPVPVPEVRTAPRVSAAPTGDGPTAAGKRVPLEKRAPAEEPVPDEKPASGEKPDIAGKPENAETSEPAGESGKSGTTGTVEKDEVGGKPAGEAPDPPGAAPEADPPAIAQKAGASSDSAAKA